MENPEKGEKKAAAQRAAMVAFAFLVAVIRKNITKVSHRSPSNKKVNVRLKSLAGSGQIWGLLLDKMREIEQVIGKPYREWTTKEFDRCAWHFLRLAESVDRPKGRPLRRKQSRGIIADVMAQGETERRKRERGEMKDFVDEYLRLESPLKTGAAAKRYQRALIKDGASEEDANERLRLGRGYKDVLDALFSDWYTEDEILESRLPPSLLKRFFLQIGGNPARFNAFRMKISRARKRMPRERK